MSTPLNVHSISFRWSDGNTFAIHADASPRGEFRLVDSRGQAFDIPNGVAGLRALYDSLKFILERGGR